MIEEKIITKKRFSLAVENLVVTARVGYMDAMLMVIIDREIDYVNIPKLLTSSLKSKLEQEAIQLNMLDGDKPVNVSL
jgi:hypothetical protein